MVRSGRQSADNISRCGLEGVNGAFPRVHRPRVIVRNVTVPVHGLSTELAGFRIAHISDFHFRRWNRVHQAAQDLLLTLEYDLLVVTGDFCVNAHRLAKSIDLTRRFFEPIAERSPVYAVLGNHDHPAMLTSPDMPLVFLRNQSVLIQRAGAVLELAGVDQSHFGEERLDSTLAGSGPRRFTILLAHYPSTVFRLPAGRVDLQLSGHTHGGQIRFPYLGCLWTNDLIPRRMAGGLHRLAGTPLHISSGIGVSLPLPVRINCPPELAVLTLHTVEHEERSTPAEALVTAASPSHNRVSLDTPFVLYYTWHWRNS